MEQLKREASEAAAAVAQDDAQSSHISTDMQETLARLDTSKLQEALDRAERLGDTSTAGVQKAMHEAGVPKEAVDMLLSQAANSPLGQKSGKQSQNDDAEAMEVEPTPAFVVKALTTSKPQEKVFVNVCGSDALPAPNSWSGGQMPLEVKEHLQKADEGDESASDDQSIPDSLRFPLSCDTGRLELDAHGHHIQTHDVIVASEIVQQAMLDQRFKSFLAQLAVSYVAQKAQLQLSDSFKMPKRRYVGEHVHKQRIRARNSAAGPTIEEVGTGEGAALKEPDFALRPSKNLADTDSNTLPYVSTSLSFDGTPVTSVATLRIGVPRKHKPSDVRISVIGDTVHIDAPTKAHTQVDLPFDADGSKCEADVESGSNDRVVQVRLPHKPLTELVQEAKERQINAGIAQLDDVGATKAEGSKDVERGDGGTSGARQYLYLSGASLNELD